MRLNASELTEGEGGREKDGAMRVGTEAAGWGEATHININREKVPFLLQLLRLGYDVVLVDADVAFLSTPQALFHPTADFQPM